MESHQQSVESGPAFGIVRMFWQAKRSNETFARETIIPKGAVELIFNLDQAALVEASIGTKCRIIPRCFISGYNTVPVSLHIPRKQIFFGIFLQPTVLNRLFGISASEYSNDCIDLTLIDRSTNTLWHQLAEAKDFYHRMTIFTSWITSRVHQADKREKLFDTFLQNSNTRFLTPAEVSNFLCYSPRHLSRKLYELTGMNMEQTLIFQRYVAAVKMMHQASTSLTTIAHTCGFSDQSHFSKTFRSFAGMTATEYRGQSSQITGHIFHHVR